MHLKELEGSIAKGESDSVEFKKSTSQLQGIAETLCGFLNCKGGTVLLESPLKKRNRATCFG